MESPTNEGWYEAAYAYDGEQPHAVTSVARSAGTDSYVYDENGNMTCRIEDGVTFKHTFNAENRISKIEKLDGNCDSTTVLESWSYAYDGDGTRVSTLHNSTLTRYYFGGAYEETGGAVRKYYSVAGQTVAMREGTPPGYSGGLKYFLTDHLGSVVSVLDSSGSVLEQQRYMPFGEPRTVPDSPITSTDFTYTFQRNLPDTGLMDYRARFYSPKLAKFVQPDSIVPSPANPQSYNRYTYVYNNPVKYIDPSGHCIKPNGDVDMGSYPYGTSGMCSDEKNKDDNGEKKDSGDANLEDKLSHISPDAVFWPTYTMFSLYGHSQGWTTNVYGPIFIPVGDGTFLVIMPPGQNPIVDRSANQKAGGVMIGGYVGSFMDVAEMILIFAEPTTIPEGLVAIGDLLIAGVGSSLSGQSYWNETPTPLLPPMATAGQDVLVTFTDLVLGWGGGPAVDLVTTGVSAGYDMFSLHNKNYINFSVPLNDSGDAWIVVWPYPAQ